MAELLSRLGARLGNWNDRRFGTESRPHPLHWRAIDKVAGWLYVRPDRRRRRAV